VKQFLLVAGYAMVSLVVTVLWTGWALTERCQEKYRNRYNSIVAIADGSAPSPFVKRRLLADSARVLAAVVPATTWRRVSDAIDADPTLTRGVRSYLGWRTEHDPLLLSATLLIWLSALGFMFACRWIMQTVYETSPGVAGWSGLVLGVALLGGSGEGHYQSYPYDIPNAFVFALTLGALLARRPGWAVWTFALAAYSKETAVLLIVAHVLLADDRRSRRFWIVLGLMSAIFVSCRLWVQIHHDMPPGANFWWPRRNIRVLGTALLFDFWPAPLVLVLLVRLKAMWSRSPLSLRRLLVLGVMQVSLAVFKGWIEEKRQYLEMLPIVGPLVIQWVLVELGLGSLLRARDGQPQPGTPARPTGLMERFIAFHKGEARPPERTRSLGTVG
jgi:hypothetical protein